jgi:predicted MFS family arabinose efflux permease
MFVVFALASALAPSIAWLIVFRFLLGLGVGADYPISAAFVAEIAPARVRNRLLVGAFSFQAVGQLLGVFVGLIILHVYPHLDAWRWMLAFGVIPALVIVWLRRKTPESPKWLASQGRLEECAEVLSIFCQRRVEVVEIGAAPRGRPEEEQVVAAAVSVESVGTEVAVAPPGVLEPPPGTPPAARWRDLFSPRWRKATLLTSVPWFLMDIATYGVGVFTPTIIAAILLTNSAAHSTQKDVATAITETKGAAFVDLFLIVGFVLAIWLIVKVGKVVLQVTGFIAMAVGLAVLALASSLSTAGQGNIGLVLVGFAVFNIFMNMGPNSTTFVMPAVVFETKVRAAGSGVAASAGKCGAALGALLFPTLQAGLGLPGTLVIIAAGAVLAAVVTFVLRREAKEPVGGWGVLFRGRVPIPAA